MYFPNTESQMYKEGQPYIILFYRLLFFCSVKLLSDSSTSVNPLHAAAVKGWVAQKKGSSHRCLRLPTPPTHVRTRALRLPDSWNQKKKGKEDESLRAFAKFHYVRSFTSCYFNALMLEEIYFLVLLDPRSDFNSFVI